MSTTTSKWFAIVALALLASLSAVPQHPVGASSACEPSPDAISHGPRLGVVTAHTASVWLRTCERADVAVQFKGFEDDWSPSTVRDTGAVTTDAAHDYTAVVTLRDLSPDERYDYRVLVDGELPEKFAGGTFRTLPLAGQAARITFMVASDLHHPYEPLPTQILQIMGKKSAYFSVMMGDLIWIEQMLTNLGRCCIPESQADYSSAYQDAYAYPAFRDFLTNTPTLMIWDDHEILNDWDLGGASPYPWARSAFEDYVASANPPPREPGGLHFTYRAGDIEFYVLDTRSYRTPGEGKDGPDKSILGAAQKEDLKAWLLSSTARFKFIVSSVMWNDFARHTIVGEAWPAYATERAEIFDFIRDRRVSGVVLLSGDEHFAGAFHILPWGIYEVAPAPLGWKLAAPSVTDPQVLFTLGWTRIFGLFTADTTVCPATLEVHLIDHLDRPRFSRVLTEANLGADGDGDGLVPCEEERVGTAPLLPDTDDDGLSDGSEVNQYGTDPLLADTDADGCLDGAEVDAAPGGEMAGGRRDPLSFWDFFDTPDGNNVRDGTVNLLDDVLGVATRFGATGDPSGDPLAAPVPPGPAYHTAFDRGPLVGPNSWDLGPADGAINVLDDILGVAAQFGHRCA